VTEFPYHTHNGVDSAPVDRTANGIVTPQSGAGTPSSSQKVPRFIGDLYVDTGGTLYFAYSLASWQILKNGP
jgi:hypothetical protein